MFLLFLAVSKSQQLLRRQHVCPALLGLRTSIPSTCVWLVQKITRRRPQSWWVKITLSCEPRSPNASLKVGISQKFHLCQSWRRVHRASTFTEHFILVGINPSFDLGQSRANSLSRARGPCKCQTGNKARSSRRAKWQIFCHPLPRFFTHRSWCAHDSTYLEYVGAPEKWSSRSDLLTESSAGLKPQARPLHLSRNMPSRVLGALDLVVLEALGTSSPSQSHRPLVDRQAETTMVLRQ